MDLGSRIRLYRSSRRLSQRELAGRLKMAPSQLSRYESGHTEPGLRVLERIARTLGVPVSEFFVGR